VIPVVDRVTGDQIVDLANEAPIVRRPRTFRDVLESKDRVLMAISTNCRIRFRNFAEHSKRCAAK